MGTVKTAISIDSKTFKQVDQLARKLHISRSRFFSQAVKYMVKKDENLELLKKINESYELIDDSLRRKKEKSYTRKKVIEEW